MTYQRHIISGNRSLIEALRQLNSLPGSSMTLFVTDDSGRVVGTITDGDIRRALIAGNGLDMTVGDASHHNFRFLREGSIDVQALREYREAGITLIPVLDTEGRLVRVIDLSRVRSELPVGAILMAGGKGERLRPMTLKVPKPLLKIEGKAIIDYNIEAIAECGIRDITVCTGYLAEQLEEHFSKPVGGVMVRCVHEDTPLGTIGAATLADIPAQGDTLVMNSDLLTTISFEEMYLRHKESGADITIGVIPYQVSVPFAVLSLDGTDPSLVTGIEEKPSYSYYANAGIYLFSNSVLKTLPEGVRTVATDLISASIAAGRKTCYYPIKGTWIDVGSPADFKQASDLMRHHKAMEKQ